MPTFEYAQSSKVGKGNLKPAHSLRPGDEIDGRSTCAFVWACQLPELRYRKSVGHTLLLDPGHIALLALLER